MKNIVRILAIIIVVTGINSCEWLDVVPDNMPTIDDAFRNRASAERSLFSCFSYLPDPTNPFGNPAYYTNRDEFEYGTHTQAYLGYACHIARGEQNADDPYLDYWSGGRGAKSMFRAIQTCNTFLEGIHQPRDLQEFERRKWVAEVKFLKAYYHFWLLQLYGPIPIIRENLPLSANPDEVRVFREPVDECVAYIAALIDEAVPDLPLIISNPTEEAGRITKPIALAIKAKAMVWAASPLFNGNSDYRGWIDSRGKQLVSDTYSPEKWAKAAEALRNAIDTCHLAQHELYKFERSKNTYAFRMNDSIALTMNTRQAITDNWNVGNIWSSTRRFGYDKWGISNGSTGDIEVWQRSLFPCLYASDAAVGLVYASFNMTDLFYTKNGIPIDEDNEWNYDGRYELRLSTAEAGNRHYIPIGQQTAALNFDREPRYYANLGFDRGYYELSSETTNFGASFSRYVALRLGDPGNNFIPNNTGYYVKKLVAYESKANYYSGKDYRFPLIRLADLYLMYSEALNEAKDAPDDEVYKWIDDIRAIVGLKGVVDSWQKSKYPNRPKDKVEMRKIIQQERLIELAFEGQRFWDMRRWKLAAKSRTYAPQGWNNQGKTAKDYYTITNSGTAARFSTRDYLWPIRTHELLINPNLVQSYGW